MTGKNLRFNSKKMPLRVQVILGLHSKEILLSILDFLKEKSSQKELLSLRLVSRHLVNLIPDYLKSETITAQIQDYRKVVLESLTPRSFYEASPKFDPSTKLTDLQKLTWKEKALQAAYRRFLITKPQLMKSLSGLIQERKEIKQAKRRYKRRVTSEEFPELS